MTVVELHQQIDNSDDGRKKLILSEREKYLSGDGKSHNWSEVKDMAMKGKKPLQKLTTKEEKTLSNLPSTM